MKALTNALGSARERHRGRGRPSGFGFAFYDSIDSADREAWDALVDSFFMSRAYLGVLERTRPANLIQRYAFIYRGATPVAAVATELLSLRPTQFVSTGVAPPKGNADGGARAATARIASRLGRAVLGRIEPRVLVCGDVFSWGAHGVAFARNESAFELWPAVAEALDCIRHAERLSGRTDIVVVKDFPVGDGMAQRALERYSYRPLATGPDMVLDIAPAWRSYDDYLASLAGKYRKAARQLGKEVESAGLTVEAMPLEEIEARADELHALYLQVHAQAKVRLATLTPAFIPALAAAAGAGYRMTAIKSAQSIVGFVTTVLDRENAVGHYMGFDRALNAEAPLYLRLLQAVVGDAIDLGARRLSLGRTALDSKARLGARPVPLEVLVRHRLPVLNVVLRSLLDAVPPDEAPERTPLKEPAG